MKLCEDQIYEYSRNRVRRANPDQRHKNVFNIVIGHNFSSLKKV